MLWVYFTFTVGEERLSKHIRSFMIVGRGKEMREILVLAWIFKVLEVKRLSIIQCLVAIWSLERMLTKIKVLVILLNLGRVVGKVSLLFQ